MAFLVDNKNTGVKQHKFLSSSITEVCMYEKSCWVICLNNDNLLIPAYKIKIHNKIATIDDMIKLSTLTYFNAKSFDEIFELTFRDYSRKLFWVAIP